MTRRYGLVEMPLIVSQFHWQTLPNHRLLFMAAFRRFFSAARCSDLLISPSSKVSRS